MRQNTLKNMCGLHRLFTYRSGNLRGQTLPRKYDNRETKNQKTHRL